MYGYIYKIINNINGKIYVGKREKSTFDESYWGSGKYITNSIKKHGKENFSREIIEWCNNRESLYEKEKYWIRTLNTQDINIGYNITAGGDGGNTLENKIKITNGICDRYINVTDVIPEDWYQGSKLKGKPKSVAGSRNIATAIREGYKNGTRTGNIGSKNGMYNNGYKLIGSKNGRYGKPCPEHVKEASKKANTGRKYSSDINKKKGRPGIKKPEGFSDNCKKNVAKYIYYLDNNTFYGQNDLILYIKNYYNYNISSAGIESILNNRKRANSLYPDLIGKIICEENYENKIYK